MLRVVAPHSLACTLGISLVTLAVSVSVTALGRAEPLTTPGLSEILERPAALLADKALLPPGGSYFDWAGVVQSPFLDGDPPLPRDSRGLRNQMASSGRHSRSHCSCLG